MTVTSELVTAVDVSPLRTLNRDKTSGLLRDTMEFQDRWSSHRVAAAAGPRLDTGRSVSWLWAKASRSIPLSVKSASGRERSLLWDMSTTRRPEVGLNSSAGMLVSWLCDRINTCKCQVFRCRSLCVLCTQRRRARRYKCFVKLLNWFWLNLVFAVFSKANLL